MSFSSHKTGFPESYSRRQSTSSSRKSFLRRCSSSFTSVTSTIFSSRRHSSIFSASTFLKEPKSTKELDQSIDTGYSLRRVEHHEVLFQVKEKIPESPTTEFPWDWRKSVDDDTDEDEPPQAIHSNQRVLLGRYKYKDIYRTDSCETEANFVTFDDDQTLLPPSSAPKFSLSMFPSSRCGSKLRSRSFNEEDESSAARKRDVKLVWKTQSVEESERNKQEMKNQVRKHKVKEWRRNQRAERDFSVHRAEVRKERKMEKNARREREGMQNLGKWWNRIHGLVSVS